MRRRFIFGSLAAIAFLVLVGFQSVVAEGARADDADLAVVAKGPSDESVVAPPPVGGSFPESGGESGPPLALIVELRIALDYGYNAAGDVTSLGITAPGPYSQSETFAYDGQDRLKQWSATGAFPNAHAYAYSAAGDRTFLTDGTTWTYAYAGDHRLTSYSKTGEAWTLAYDANGNARWRNQTSGGTTKYEYVYDAEDRLTQVKLNFAAIGTYSYDGLGRRVKAVEGATTTYFVYSGLSLVQTVVGPTTTKFVYASGLLVARTTGATTTYAHQDALGSIRGFSDAAGNWVWRTSFKPFGEEYGTGGASPASLKYTGQWRDANTGLYYLYRRFYDPALGRFLSPDPILGHLTVPQSLDRYAYTANNPLRYVDPTGESFWNPFDWIGKALDAAGRALSKIADAVVGVLDIVMTVVGFIPGLDVISDVYFLGKSLVDVAMGRGSWADVAMNAAALLLPIGGSVFRMAKKAVNALDSAGDAGKVLKNGGNAAEAAKGAAKADDVGDGRVFNRYMTDADLKKTSDAGVLRPGKEPPHYFTTDHYESGAEAWDKLALPVRPDVRVRFRIVNDLPVEGPNRVAGKFDVYGNWRPGGGLESWTNAQTRIEILEVSRLRP